MTIRQTVDANEAVARVAYAASEVIAIYPITPASPMGEFADAWRAEKRVNIFGDIPEVIEMQSEGGAAGVVHGALQAGSLSTTFTASQGLLLMIPNMYKIAGELTPTVFHVAARALATHALSIFGDHSDVMACRATGWAMLCSSTVQEAADMAVIAHATTLPARVPFLHFFDGFRTSHELNCIEEPSMEVLQRMLDMSAIEDHRQRGLSPDHPHIRGTAQNPDVFFQAREAINPFYDSLPGLVEQSMQRYAEATGRGYRLFDYYGAPDAERIIIMMGSGCGAVEEAIDTLRARGQRVGLVKVRLFRPFSLSHLADCLPDSVRSIAVLDRTKEPGGLGEPLYQDIKTAMHEMRDRGCTKAKWNAKVIGGRYGLASKEFTPAMALAIFEELDQPAPKRTFTVGIHDDVTHLSLKVDTDFVVPLPDTKQAMFFGLGSDGTVGANKNTVKIVGDSTDLHAQGYFVYDSKKSGAMTVSHLRIGKHPIRSTYLIQQADLVACHQFQFVRHVDLLANIAEGGTFLLNSPYGPETIWDHLPQEIQQTCIDKRLRLFVVDAESVSRSVGMPGRINVVMQACYFAIADLMPREEAISKIKQAIEKTYGKRGQSVLEKNYAAVDQSLNGLHEVPVLSKVTSPWRRMSKVRSNDPFIQRVTSILMEGKGDLLPVSALPIDGTFPSGTACLEKRSIAVEIPEWVPDLCIQCGLCTLMCPHAAIRMKAFDERNLHDAPPGFLHRPWSGKDYSGKEMSIQIAPDDCTGCGVCVDVCPARSKTAVKQKALQLATKNEILDRERANFQYFLSLPEMERSQLATDTVKGSQLTLPLFEFSGACAGCGETPYLKLLSQLFGDRSVIANATGCSSIYGGNLPTTPWSKNRDAQGPAWANSLFEDNAEFGLGLRLGWDKREQVARQLVTRLASQLSKELVHDLLHADFLSENGIQAQRMRVQELRHIIRERIQNDLDVRPWKTLDSVADALVRKSVWIVGGDGWAYDIGFGGLDHVLASSRNVNVLILDTEVYSNTGGQASKSTPRAAVAKFATAGKGISKKDIGMIAMAYGHVYVAQIAMGAHPLQAIKAFHEAESYPGPSLIIAYSQCIAHGVDMSTGMSHQKDAVNSGYWPLYRFDPRIGHDGGKPFHLDCRKPTIPFREFAAKEARFSMLQRSDPQRAERLLQLAQDDINDRWHYYEQIANVERSLADRMDEVEA